MQKHGPKRTPDEFKETRREYKARKKEQEKRLRVSKEQLQVQQAQQVQQQQSYQRPLTTRTLLVRSMTRNNESNVFLRVFWFFFYCNFCMLFLWRMY